ncbi:MAG: hypothetical protein WAU25_04930, partial [Nitrososphaeraceae archaeon]
LWLDDDNLDATEDSTSSDSYTSETVKVFPILFGTYNGKYFVSFKRQTLQSSTKSGLNLSLNKY